MITPHPSRSIPQAARKLHGDAAYRARKKGLRFDLTPEWVEERLYAGVCEISGVPLTLEPGHPFAPSIERMRNESNGAGRGGHYTQDNCLISATMLNRMVGKWSKAWFGILASYYVANNADLYPRTSQ